MNPSNINPFCLPFLPFEQKRNLPNCAAIYFVLQEKKILYIGRSTNLMQRWSGHHKLKEILSLETNLRIAWLECSEIGLLSEIEAALIKHLKPSLNRRRIITTSKATNNIGKEIKTREKVDRGKSDDYRQVTAFIRKDLYLKFKSALALKELFQNDVVEMLIQKWLQVNQEAK